MKPIGLHSITTISCRRKTQLEEEVKGGPPAATTRKKRKMISDDHAGSRGAICRPRVWRGERFLNPPKAQTPGRQEYLLARQ